MSLQQAFAAFVSALYRAWYGLPRHSTRAELERMRHQLAIDLAAVPAADTDTPRERVLAFVRRARRLTGVNPYTAKELGNLSIYLESPSLKPKLSDLPALIALLTEPQPAETAIRRWPLIPNRANTTFSLVRATLESGLARFPAATQRAVTAILAQVDAGAIKPIDALGQLQQIDDVLRVAWEALLAGKTETIQRTLGGERELAPAALPQFAPASAPPTPVGVTTHFYTDVRFPRTIKRGDRQPLFLRLTLNQVKESIATDAVPVEFADPTTPELLDVVLNAPGFSDEFTAGKSAPRRTIIVRSDQDSEPAVFWLKAQTAGKQQLTIDFYHHDKLIGGTRFSVEITEGQTSTIDVAIDADQRDAELRLTQLPAPADLELRVIYDRAAGILRYMLHSTKGEVNYHWSLMGEQTLEEKEAATFFDAEFGMLGELAAFGKGALSDTELAEFSAAIEAKGQTLFEKLFSPELQAAYWTIKELREQGKVRSLLITTDEPWIPWELIKPYSYDPFKDKEESDAFLGESFEVCRWLSGYGPYDTLTVTAASLVVPDTDLAYSGGDGADFDLMTQQGVTVAAPLTTRADVLKLITDGRTQLIHFATHAAFNSDKPEESPVELADGELLPSDLDNKTLANLRKVRPIVFLNACQSGRIGYKLSGMDGWAERLVRKVRATAFIGTLWEVNDELAAAFATKFYGELLAQKQLGAAFHAARLHIKEIAPANPTWLAYTLYGDPNTRIEWGNRPSHPSGQ